MHGNSADAAQERPCTKASACRQRVVEIVGEWRRGARPNTGAVLSELPELRQFDSLVIEMAYVEFCSRVTAGEAISVEAFCSQFPRVAATLRRQIDLNDMVGAYLVASPNDENAVWPTTGAMVQGFELQHELGRGAFARVHLAEEKALGNRQVSVKLSHSGAFEANVLGRLQHRNIMPIHSAQRDPSTGLFVICMPYLGRATLRDVIVMRRTNGPPFRMAAVLESIRTANRGLPEPAIDDDSGAMDASASYTAGVAWFGAQMAEALSETHRRGILHLDLKPTNVLLTKRGIPKLIDFNLAAELHSTTTGLGGTLSYMSPEQLRCMMDGIDAARIDHRSDIFSLGLVLHELLTGALPDQPERNGNVFSSESTANVKCSPVSTCASSDRTNDHRLMRIIRRCLASDPCDRYQDCDELRCALQHELTFVPRTERWLRRHPRLAGASCQPFPNA